MSGAAGQEMYNPWTVVNLVFAHLAEQGLHPLLGESGDPSAPAAELLRSLGIVPGDPSWARDETSEKIQDELAELRALFDPAPGGGGDGVSAEGER